MRIGTLLALAAMTAVANAGPRLNEVSFEKKDGGVEVAIRGDGLAAPKVLRVKGGVAYILEFAGTFGQKSKQNLQISTAGLESVQANWFSARPPKVRVAFRVDPSVEPKLEATDYGYRVVFGSLGPADAYAQQEQNPLVEAVTKQAETNGKGKVPISNEAKPEPKKTLPNPVDILMPEQKQEPLPGEIVASSAAKTKVSAPKPAAKAKINLDFVNTEIGIVLKALAMQANVNVATAPDIKGAISVKLEHVTVEQALDIVTAMAGLRWATVNNTYVVAPKDKFSDMMRALNKADGRPSDTRIVPIYSGEVDQIRNAVSRAVPQDSSRGSFDIIVPGSEVKKAAGGEGDPKKDDGGQADANKSSGGATTFGQTYIILVGNSDALDSAQALIESIDKNICETYGIAYGGSNKIEQDTYLITSESMAAKSLIDTVRQLGGSAFRNVEMYPSPTSSDRQAIILIGRGSEIERAKRMLEEFDGASDEVSVYAVRFGDPRSLRDELAANIPGLRVMIPAGSAMTPRIYEPPAKKTGKTSEADGGQGSVGSKAEDVSAKAGKADIDGLDLPFSDFEKTAKPMRLVLRGNKTQVARALEYLAKVDIEPKQVALDLRVMEISREEAQRVGLDWSILTGGTVRSIRINQGLGDTAATAGTISGDLQRRGSTASILGTLDSISNNRTLLNRPNFVAVDGRETELFVGDVIRYIESIQSSQNGVTVTTNSIRVGVRCAVLARVSGDNQIMMDLRPVVSYLKGYIPVPGGGQLPQTAERMAQSSVMIEDGETIALGGLIKDEDRKVVSGVPFLKDLPIVGKLFQRTDNNRQRTEIVFFLTAKVVDKKNRGDAAMPRANVARDAQGNALPTYPDPFPKDKPKGKDKPKEEAKK